MSPPLPGPDVPQAGPRTPRNNTLVSGANAKYHLLRLCSISRHFIRQEVMNPTMKSFRAMALALAGTTLVTTALAAQTTYICTTTTRTTTYYSHDDMGNYYETTVIVISRVCVPQHEA